MTAKSCKNCKFFVSEPKSNIYGECHRYPPVCTVEGIRGVCKPVFDATHVDARDWCGEFKPAKAKP